MVGAVPITQTAFARCTDGSLSRRGCFVCSFLVEIVTRLEYVGVAYRELFLFSEYTCRGLDEISVKHQLITETGGGPI